jgi:hypothetical protein
MVKGEMTCNALMDRIKGAYRKRDFWAKQAKRLYPTITFIRPGIHWQTAIAGFVAEFGYIEMHYAPVLELTRETSVEFLCRLTSAMKLKNQISSTEEEQFITFFISRSAMHIPDKPYAQALIFKACLELGRLRPAARKIPSVVEFAKEARTVRALLEYPLERPLPRVMSVDTIHMSSDEVSAFFSAFRSTADYHLAASHYLAEFQYHRAMSEIARFYLNMDEAYTSLCSRSNRSDSERTFVENYERINSSMA